ncbi:hypothetical protein GCM10023238_03380 [Streptomyces heliomycini]
MAPRFSALRRGGSWSRRRSAGRRGAPGPGGGDRTAVALFTAAPCVSPVIAAITARETRRVPTERLGGRVPAQGAERPGKVTA